VGYRQVVDVLVAYTARAFLVDEQVINLTSKIDGAGCRNGGDTTPSEKCVLDVLGLFRPSVVAGVLKGERRMGVVESGYVAGGGLIVEEYVSNPAIHGSLTPPNGSIVEVPVSVPGHDAIGISGPAFEHMVFSHQFFVTGTGERRRIREERV
jgi:hypothetical protein